VEKSPAYLEKRSNGEAVKAEICDDISDEHVQLWRTSWLPPIEQAVRLLKENNVPKEKWPQDLHWKWDEKTDWSRGYLSLRRFALTCEEDLQGLMLVNLTKLTGRLDSQKGKDLAYLEYVSTAPWNRIDLTDKPIFRGVGLIMVRTAVELSHAEGFRRRIGLHSLPQAAHFYRTVCGMADLGLDTAYHNLRYFEMTEAQAAKFCS
jgi:hypothetical protein